MPTASEASHDIEAVITTAKAKAKEGLCEADLQGNLIIEIGEPRPVKVYLDVAEDLELRKIYDQKMAVPNLNRFTFGESRNSIIPIVQEVLLHAEQLLNTISTLTGQKDELLNPDTRAALNKKIVDEVMKTLREENIKAATSVLELNELINQARPALFEKAREILAARVQFELTPEALIQLEQVDDDKFKEDMNATGAIPMDVCRVNALGQVDYIQATEFTAHSKQHGRPPALRAITRARIDQAGVVSITEKQFRARVPSIAIVSDIDMSERFRAFFSGKKLPQKTKDENDVTQKLTAISEQISEQTVDSKAPMYYNLLTSLYSSSAILERKVRDPGNKQSASARRIMIGMHNFNRQQSLKGNGFFYLQNLSVNEHGAESLNLTRAESRKNGGQSRTLYEAKLMSDLAMVNLLKTLHGNSLDKDSKDLIQTINNAYTHFLKESSSPKYYGDSEFSAYADRATQELKKHLKTIKRPEKSAAPSFDELAKDVITKMYCNGDHSRRELGRLEQALLIHLEDRSISGCKSANERFSIIDNRVAVLDALSAPDDEVPEALKKHKEAMNAVMKDYIEGRVNATDLEDKLSEITNELNVYGSGTVICSQDTGGSFKVTRNTGSTATKIKTYAAASRLETNMVQDNAKDAQAHKMVKSGKFKAFVNTVCSVAKQRLSLFRRPSKQSADAHASAARDSVLPQQDRVGVYGAGRTLSGESRHEGGAPKKEEPKEGPKQQSKP
jgi:hypothetical protein